VTNGCVWGSVAVAVAVAVVRLSPEEVETSGWIRSADTPRLEAVGPKLEAREERLQAVCLRLEAKGPTVQVSERPLLRDLTVAPQMIKGLLRCWRIPTKG